MGRLSWFSLRLMSENCFSLSFTLSVELNVNDRKAGKAQRPDSKVRGLGGFRVEFIATTCSMGRVISCSTCSAVAPGHGHCAEATRTGMFGSFRFGML